MLYCWVRGEEVSSAFGVKISRTETVGALKETIKTAKQADFRDVDANALVLYKPLSYVPRPYKENLSNTTLSEQTQLLEVADGELSEVFPELPPKYHIHLIVGM